MKTTAQYDVFLSHNSADTLAVEQIAHRLVEEVGLSPFLDVWHLIPGAPWQEAIEEVLEQCESVAVFVGPSGINPWHNEEMRAGLDRAVRNRNDVRVIPVLLPGADPKNLPTFLTRRTYADFRLGLNDPDAFTHLVAGILGRPPKPSDTSELNQTIKQGDTFKLPDEPAPYPSLLSFTTQQRRFFFGRDDECKKLLERVDKESFTAVIGASGSGKSSLVQAGLLPMLKQNWRTLSFVPGPQPIRALAEQLTTLFPSEVRLQIADDLEQRLFSRTDGLSKSVSAVLVDRSDITTLLLVVDQFEELFTQVLGLSNEKQYVQQAFIANLANVVHTLRGKVRIVITLRADYIRHCLDFADLRALLETNQLLLGPMSEVALREAIVKPAQVVGAMFEKGLVERIVNDMRNQPSALPLLQTALAQLWQKRQGVWLTHEVYEGFGGITGAIDQRAETVYSQLNLSQQQLARNLFVRLVTLSDDTSDTRRRMRHDELNFVGATSEEVEQLIGILSHRDVRLIATDAETVELAHEALITQWGRLHTWLEENRAALRTHRRLTEAAYEWQSHDQEESYLYSGVRLVQALEWARIYGEAMNTLESAFIEASQSHEKARTVAEESARIARERLLAELPLARAGESLFELGRKPERALLLAIAAVRASSERQPSMVLRALYRVFESSFIRTILRGHADRLSAVTWSPDGQYVLTGSYDRTARIWDMATGQTVRTFIGHADAVTSVAWSPDGQKILTGSWDNTARIWNVETGNTVLTLTGHSNWVSSVSWSPDGQLIATGSMDHTARLWSAETGETVQTLVGHTEWVRSAEWSVDGQRILTGSYDGTASLWDARTGICLRTFRGHTNAVASVAWSSTGQQALTASEDGTVRLWDIATGETLRVLYVHTSPVYTVVWSPDGNQALTGSEDGSVRIWDVATGTVERTLPGHTGWISSVAWSRDGRYVVSSSEDATARICDLVAGAKLSTLRHTRRVSSVAWSPIGSQVVTACGESAAYIWEATTGKRVLTLDAHASPIVSATYSPDGNKVLTGCKDGTAYIWDVRIDTVVKTLLGHTNEIGSIAWSPTGQQVITGSRDGTARIWNTENGINVHTFWHKDFIPLGVGVAVAWSPGGQRILIGTSDKVKRAYIWDVVKREEVLILTGHRAMVQAVAWSPDERQIVTTCGDGTAHIWNAITGDEICTLYPGESQSVAWSPIEQQVLTGSHSGIARIWDAVTGAEVHTLEHRGPVRSVAWSPDGLQIVTGSWDMTACIWNLRSTTITAEITRRVCTLYSDEDIVKEIPNWRGHIVEIAELGENSTLSIDDNQQENNPLHREEV